MLALLADLQNERGFPDAFGRKKRLNFKREFTGFETLMRSLIEGECEPAESCPSGSKSGQGGRDRHRAITYSTLPGS